MSAMSNVEGDSGDLEFSELTPPIAYHCNGRWLPCDAVPAGAVEARGAFKRWKRAVATGGISVCDHGGMGTLGWWVRGNGPLSAANHTGMNMAQWAQQNGWILWYVW